MKRNIQGTLLLEVLVAAAILSIGILSCLNIFSAAIHASSRTYETSVAQSYLEQSLFNYFLDPTSVDLDTGDRSLTTDGKSLLAPSLKVESLNPPEVQTGDPKDKKNTQGKSGEVQPPKPSVMLMTVPVEFFKTGFIAERKQGKIKYQYDEILFRYGKKNKK